MEDYHKYQDKYENNNTPSYLTDEEEFMERRNFGHQDEMDQRSHNLH